MTQNAEPGAGWERVARAVDKVRDRLHRAVAALKGATIPYAVVGGHAVAAWVSQVDDSATRVTPDVDILTGRRDFEAVARALGAIGFVQGPASPIATFLDGPGAKPRDAVHILFAGEKVRSGDLLASPTMVERKRVGDFDVVNLDALVRMKLTSYRDKDRTHLRDMIDVGLIDTTWPARLPKELGDRLQAILDTPEGRFAVRMPWRRPSSSTKSPQISD